MTDVRASGAGLINAREWEVYAGLRYFLPATNKRIQPFLVLHAGWASTSFEVESSNFGIESSKGFGSFAEGGAGTIYMLTKQTALDLSLRYQTGIDSPVSKAQSMVASAGLKVFLGK
jgi:hypothetical protein